MLLERRVRVRWLSMLGAVLLGAGYGLVMRLLMESFEELLSVMSVAFLFVMPVALGLLVGVSAPYGPSLAYRIFVPWLAVLLFVLGTALAGFEGAICIAMMVPLALPLASAGGIFSRRLVRDWPPDEGPPRKPMIAILLFPLLFGLIEERLPRPQSTRQVWTTIEIDATPAEVWQQIERVPLIEHHERRPNFFHWIGFPHPLEATLDGTGVGAVRHASFDGGIVFEEVVTAWEPDRLLAFSIDVAPESIPTTTLDEHVSIGGTYFDTLNGTYRIEPLPAGADGKSRGVVLHLGSEHRLSTRFNFYAGLWTDAIMSSIQDDILRVIEARCVDRR